MELCDCGHYSESVTSTERNPRGGPQVKNLGARTSGTAGDTPAVKVEGLTMRYGERTVVNDLSFTVTRGNLTAVLGPNGAGKTTTIECCEGLRSPTGGAIEIFGLPRAGKDVSPSKLRQADAELRSRVGVMLQDGGLPAAANVKTVLRHFARLHDHPIRPAELIEMLDLTEVGGVTVRRLSGGQRQRLALACALIGRPELVFLDEPSAGLDPHSRRSTWELITSMRDAGTTFVLTTHMMEEADFLADDVLILDHGKMVARGTPAELRGKSHLIQIHGEPHYPALPNLVEALTTRGWPATISADTLTIHAQPTAATMARLSSDLIDLGLADAQLTVAPRTLETVFLALTGRAPAGTTSASGTNSPTLPSGEGERP